VPALPWTSSRAVEPEREYLVLASALPLRRFRATPGFMRMALQIRRQLADAPGLVGYSLDARPLARRYWTLSAWEDRDALTRFVAASPHAAVMTTLRPRMGTTRFTTWHLPGSALPPRWSDARARLDAEARKRPRGIGDR
jgi:heme-degrading monooxygenase HmoA